VLQRKQEQGFARFLADNERSREDNRPGLKDETLIRRGCCRRRLWKKEKTLHVNYAALQGRKKIFLAVSTVAGGQKNRDPRGRVSLAEGASLTARETDGL